MGRPYASDWEDVGEGIQHSPSLELWWRGGKVYDRASAQHNGIIGLGRDLADMLKGTHDG